jgi:hypothetical protein
MVREYMAGAYKEDYRGWTNRATWAVNLWLNNEPEPQAVLEDIARKPGESFEHEDELREYVEELLTEKQEVRGLGAHLLDIILDEVNWVEILDEAVS